MVLVPDLSGNSAGIDANYTSVQLTGAQSYVLCKSGITLAATSGSTPVYNIDGGNYSWDVQFTGTSVKLQQLGADGATWRDIATATVAGITAVVLGQNAAVRLYNPNATNDTAVSSTIS